MKLSHLPVSRATLRARPSVGLPFLYTVGSLSSPFLVALTMLTFSLCTVHSAWASDGSLFSAKGEVEVLRQKTSVWQVAAKDAELFSGDSVRTGIDSRAGIVLADGSLIRLGPSSSITVRGKGGTEPEGLFVQVGKAFFFSKSDEHTPEIQTPTVSAAIRGTEFTIEVDANQTTIAVLDGSVECYNTFGTVPAREGELVITKKGEAPVKTVLIKPKEYVQWVMHVPPILDGDSARVSTSSDPELRRAYDLFKAGDLARAKAFAGAILARNPQSVPALTILALTNVAEDDPAAALSAATKAAQADSTSEMGPLALSYALQSKGDVEGALSALNEKDTTSSPFFLARRAELLLARNDVTGAREAVEQSLASEKSTPQSRAYAFTVQGFLLMIENEPEAALEAFSSAANLDDTYPVTYLGRGLALTQLGEAEEGANEIAKSVHLSPTTAIYRSYLGKAMFELHRGGKAKDEFARAISLDPNDPTPRLYRSFQRLADNDVVGALEDVTASVKLNDNRAVYRSSLLLDQDQAVRKASLAEVFAALGFGEVARVQALSSLNQDYTNFSAHRYLANAYTRNFQFEAGRSARALSNLLAPLGFNSLQPLGQNSFGDYTTLFERNESRTNINTSVDSQLQRATASVTQSGRDGDLGYLVSGSGLYNDYSPMSAQLKDGLVSASLQYQPSHQFKAFTLAEIQGRQVRTQPTEVGAESDQVRRYAITTGATVQLAPEWSTLSVVAFQHGNNDLRQPSQSTVDLEALTDEGVFEGPILANFFDDTKQKPDQLQISNQLLYHGKYATLTAGHELFVSQVDRQAQSTLLNDEFDIQELRGVTIPSSIDSSLRNHSFFAYSTLHLLPSLDLSVGGAFATVESENRFITPFSPDTARNDRFTPKAAVSWRPTTWATFRAAYIESFERTILEGLPSYEPAIVGAINQRYFDFPHTFSRNKTVALDLNPSAKTFLGFEATHRDLTLLEIAPGNFGVDLTQEDGSIPSSITLGGRPDVHQDVDLLSSYFYHVLTDWLVSSVEYRFTLDNTFDPARRFRIETHRGTFGLRAFNSAGWFVKGSSTYLSQQRTLGLPEENGSTNNLLVDAGIGYRLKERHGIIELDFKNLLDRDLNVEPLLEVDTVYLSGFGVQLVGTFNF